MKRAKYWGALLLALAVFAPVPASAVGLGVEIWTDRGDDAVYRPGEGIQIKVRASDDAYLLVYEIDAEGYVHVLYPYHGGRGMIEGRQTMRLPESGSREDLVVNGPTGEGYIVAIASRDPFERLPWYLRPEDEKAAEIGYVGDREDEEGVTSDGKIVGDPFVAMERIRREVLASPEDRDEFATAYTNYYVHQRVRYPRYVCADCHRPNRWAWWDGYDPYYTTCRVFDFRVNYDWYWGPSYWFGYSPYYVYVVRHDCPPYYRDWGGWCYSSWDGWPRWNTLWGGHLTRYKSSPPPGYVPPYKYGWENRLPGAKPPPGLSVPPGFLATADARGRLGGARPLPLQRASDDRPVVTRTDWRPGGEVRKPAPGRTPVTPGGTEERPGVGRGRDDGPSTQPSGGREGGPRIIRPGAERQTPPGRGRDDQGTPSERPGVNRPSDRQTPREGGPRYEPRRETPAPREGNPRYEPRRETPAPRQESPRYEPRRETPAPRQESPRYEPRREAPAPRQENPRYEQPKRETPKPRQENPRYDPPRRETPPPRQERPSQPNDDRQPPKDDHGRADRGRRG